MITERLTYWLPWLGSTKQFSSGYRVERNEDIWDETGKKEAKNHVMDSETATKKRGMGGPNNGRDEKEICLTYKDWLISS